MECQLLPTHIQPLKRSGDSNNYNASADPVHLPLQPEAGQRITALWNAELNLPPVVRDFSHQITDTIHRMHTGQNPLIPVVMQCRAVIQSDDSQQPEKITGLPCCRKCHTGDN